MLTSVSRNHLVSSLAIQAAGTAQPCAAQENQEGLMEGSPGTLLTGVIEEVLLECGHLDGSVLQCL